MSLCLWLLLKALGMRRDRGHSGTSVLSENISDGKRGGNSSPGNGTDLGRPSGVNTLASLKNHPLQRLAGT